MGYSPRYHAASLMAVFAALLIGIVIGAGLGSEVVADTTEGLESSLQEDLDEARAEVEAGAASIGRLQSYADRSFPLVVEDRLRRRRLAIVGLGDASVTTTREIEEAVSPAGGRLVSVAILDEEPDRAALADGLGAKRRAGLGALGELIGRSMAARGDRADRAAGVAFSRSTGELSRIDGVILVRDDAAPAGPSERSAEFERGIVSGLAESGAQVVGVERFDRAESAVPWFSELGADTVDNVDETTGKTSLVFALSGVRGDFGRKETADRLIPDLLTVPSRAR